MIITYFTDFNKFNLSINNTDWNNILNNDIDDYVTNFINTIDLCINNYSRKISRKCKFFNHKLKPWIIKRVIVSIRYKEKMYSQKIKNQSYKL